MSNICAIHQPNFFPWLGYFNKIERATLFVVLDNVQNQKTGSSWVNRVKLNCFGQAKWFTAPIKRYSGLKMINEIEFLDHSWRDDLMQVLANYYKNYPNFVNGMSIIKNVLQSNLTINVCEFNIHALRSLCAHLNIPHHFILQSELGVQTKATQLLIDITRTVNCSAYLCGGGTAGYQIDHLFAQNEIKLIYQNYVPKPYGQQENYIAGLSVIDYLMSMKI